MFSIRIFSIKWRNLFALPLAFPFGESGGEAADRGLFKISPYVAASPCLKKNSANFIFFGKNGNPFLTSRLPPGGRLRREAVVRGASCFLSGSFQSSGATCSPFPCFPLRAQPCRIAVQCNPGKYGERRSADKVPCVFLKNRQSGGKKILAAALIFNRCSRYSGNR